jgi:hypothetical protein
MVETEGPLLVLLFQEQQFGMRVEVVVGLIVVMVVGQVG